MVLCLRRVTNKGACDRCSGAIARLQELGPYRAFLLCVMPRLLIIDDDVALRMAVAEYLSSLGHEVHEAGEREEAEALA